MISSTAAAPISAASTRWASVARERFDRGGGFGSDMGALFWGNCWRKPARANGPLRRGGRDGGRAGFGGAEGGVADARPPRYSTMPRPASKRKLLFVFCSKSAA